MSEAWIIDAGRTPRGIGKVGKGALADMHPQHLAATVLKALDERNNLDTAEVDDIIWGCSSQKGTQGGDLGRMSALDAGYDVRSSGMTLDRFCGSGITVVNMAAASIMSGMEELMIAGGCEMMSHDRHAARRPPACMDAGNMRLRANASAIAPGRVRRRDRDAGRHYPRSASTSWPGKPAARRRGHRAERPFHKSLVPVYNGRRHAGARPRGIPPPADHAEGLAALNPAFSGMADCRSTRRARPSQADPARSIRTSRSSTCTTPAIRRAWSTARAACCWHRRATPRRGAWKPRARVRGHGQRGRLARR